MALNWQPSEVELSYLPEHQTWGVKSGEYYLVVEVQYVDGRTNWFYRVTKNADWRNAIRGPARDFDEAAYFAEKCLPMESVKGDK